MLDAYATFVALWQRLRVSGCAVSYVEPEFMVSLGAEATYGNRDGASPTIH